MVKKRENKPNNTLIIITSLFLSFLIVVSLFLIKEKKIKKEIDKKEAGEHFNKTKLSNYFKNLSIKYKTLNRTITNIKDCEKINITKERILCKEYFKEKEREIIMYKPYLIFALVKYGVITPKEAIDKYNIPKEKLAEALDNESFCFGDEDCLKQYKNFKKYYLNSDVIKENINTAWEYYQKGLLNLKNYTNPYNVSCDKKSGCELTKIN